MTVSTTDFLRNIVLLATTILMVLPSIANAGIDDPDITLASWAKVTYGKRVMVKYFDPYSENCKAFQKDIWSKLEDKYRDDETIDIVEVNCQSRYGLQMCIERGIGQTPSVQWGDTTIQNEYLGKGDYDALVDFVEAKLRKPLCSAMFPEGCDEKDRDDVVAIDKLTVEYFEKLAAFKIKKPDEIANQVFLKLGKKNFFKNDYDDMEDDGDDDDNTFNLEWDGMPEDE